MEVSRQDLLNIVEQASTLSERLGVGGSPSHRHHFIRDEAKVNEKQIISRLEAWCQIVAQGNPEKFAKRLAWDGMDFSTIVSVLGAVRLADAQQLPIWAETLREACKQTWKHGMQVRIAV